MSDLVSKANESDILRDVPLDLELPCHAWGEQVPIAGALPATGAGGRSA